MDPRLDRPKEAIDRLFEAAVAARAHAYAPYSGFAVGAAIRTASGAVFAGANIENAAYPVGLCAEAAAIATMVVAGERQIAEILILAESGDPIMPCGACRQRLFEFATPEMKVHSASLSGVALSLTLAELLPHAFGRQSLAP
ncbi:MAG: cytidine deaminase [Methylovirgula sp.]